MKVTVKHVDGMRFLVTPEKHTVVVDAGPEDGDRGTAINAPRLFAAAVGGCKLHEVPVEQLNLHMAFDEVPGPRRIGALKGSLQMEPEPPRSVKRRLMGVATHATLVNTLGRPPEVDIRFGGNQDAPIAET